ncbi:MAG: septum site-determining protein MinD [Firmicutes bacterium]|nr:septum site-determining protein MinD [Bacillota bacterium]
MGKTVVVCSGKGGTGKTMFVSNIGAMLAKRGHKVCVLDMDTGLRNLDLYLGLENNVVYDVADVLSGVCRIKQALVKHKSFPGLYFMAASPKPDEGEFTPLHLKVLCDKLNMKFDYVIVDCPAGLDDGLAIATGGADQVIMVITPEYSSVRDAEAVTSNLVEQKMNKIHYILNKVNVDLVREGYELSLEDLPEVIRRRLIGIIKDDRDIHISTNLGMPAVFQPDTYIYNNFYKIAGRIEKL